MLRYLIKLRNRKGFTLVELIIVVAILALLMACVAAFSTPVQKMVKATSASADALAANKIIGDYIESRLAYASKINVVYNINAVTVGIGTDHTTHFDAMQNLLNAGSANDRAGILLLHYDYDASAPENATYKLYDIQLPYGGSTGAGAYSSLVMTGTEPNSPVFPEPMYINSQNLIVPQPSIETNKTKGSYFMRFRIYPFDCSTDYIVRDGSGNVDQTQSVYLSSDTIQNYYAAYTPSDPELAGESLGELNTQRSGAVELVSFELRNASNKSDYTFAPAGITAQGSDILIFYYIPRF